MKTYKGYTPVVEYDESEGVLSGWVAGIRGAITFHAESVSELQHEFNTSVDIYLEMCARRGIDPEKPFSGKFALRMDPEMHRRLALTAIRNGKSINTVILEAINAVDREQSRDAVDARQRECLDAAV